VDWFTVVKRPTSIKVAGLKYKIRYDLADENAYGETNPDTNTINLRHGMPEDKLIRVLVHEITHAVVFETALATRKRLDIEEVCDIIGIQFVAVLKDNPEIVEYILQETDDDEA
jgi:hypothetical protein